MRHGILLGVALAVLAAAPSAGSDRVEVILDVSGSMRATTAGQTRIASAREAIAETVGGLPATAEVGLRFYGHRVDKDDKEASCRDTELVIPFGPVDRGRIEQVLAGAVPRGQTPLAYAMRQAAADFGPEEKAVVILVSDGEETCGEDPIAAARELLARGVELTVHTVGFDVGAEAETQLRGISDATGGEFRDARNAGELADSISALARKSLLVDKGHSVYGEPIRGGDSFETAVPLAPGVLYRLDHHQRKNQFDYFVIEVGAGQELRATVETGELGVSVKGEDFKENRNPYAGIELHAGRGRKLGTAQVIGTSNKSDAIVVQLPHGEGGPLYLLVGSTYDDQHMESRFTVALRDRFDVGSTTDAGPDEQTALALEPGRYEESHLFAGDTVDVYRLRAVAGDGFAVKARSRDASLRLSATDADGVRLVSASSPNEGAAVQGSFTVPGGGDVFVTISSPYSSVDTTYTLQIDRTGASAEAVPAASASPSGGPGSRDAARATPEARGSDRPAPTPAGEAPTLDEVRAQIAALGLLAKLRLYLELSGLPFGVGILVGMIGLWVRRRRRS